MCRRNISRPKEDKLGKIQDRLDKIDEKFNKITARIDSLESKFDNKINEIDSILDKKTEIKTIDKLLERVKYLKSFKENYEKP